MSKWVFIGDSITDSGRSQDPEGLGSGYVRMIKNELESTVQVVNKGVSGNRITDLEKRWQRDVIEANPSVLSISIGINDVWRQLDHPEMKPVYPDDFKEIFERLLNQTSKLNTKLVLMEPTIIHEDVHSKGNQMLVPYVEIVRRLAIDYDAILVPTHTVFLEQVKQNNVNLTTDGVHMTEAGNKLMANTWLEACTPKLLR
ncbi:SGNH/GDSL hydrolase family protein [Guptibacillus hwajinpoensis]|uniref:Lysophospholipase L1-like esterase n=1 Tax=Guptibacillus hwajinpoensis TaxID=208199 RepID=A0ABU0K7N5_9BACL|nr:SGNH/GDSL hydrolase family protein [Alkalihalobacillus hemicentroti]MDQ0484496.1 lysophospholipase L1-like esterase [Alkalihalobacillus hemicentroti]